MPAAAPVDPRYQVVLPPDGASYPQILRGSSFAAWRSLFGVVFGVSLFLLLSTLLTQVLVLLAWSLTAADEPYAAYVAAASRFERPLGMLATNLGIAVLLPISWALLAVLHRVQPRWLSSVQPRLRWRYLLACVGVALVALNGMLLVSSLVSEPLVFRPQPGFWAFLAVIVLTSPLQAAAEEIFFRGYLLQALGSLFAQPWVGVVVSSVVFALFHGTQNPALFVDRLVFGLLAALLVWRTGGLEAAIGAHVANNVSAYVFAGLTTSIADVRAIQEIGWADAAFDVGGFAVFAVLAWLLARRLRLERTVRLDATG